MPGTELFFRAGELSDEAMLKIIQTIFAMFIACQLESTQTKLLTACFPVKGHVTQKFKVFTIVLFYFLINFPFKNSNLDTNHDDFKTLIHDDAYKFFLECERFSSTYDTHVYSCKFANSLIQALIQVIETSVQREINFLGDSNLLNRMCHEYLILYVMSSRHHESGVFMILLQDITPEYLVIYAHRRLHDLPQKLALINVYPLAVSSFTEGNKMKQELLQFILYAQQAFEENPCFECICMFIFLPGVNEQNSFLTSFYAVWSKFQNPEDFLTAIQLFFMQDSSCTLRARIDFTTFLNYLFDERVSLDEK